MLLRDLSMRSLMGAEEWQQGLQLEFVSVSVEVRRRAAALPVRPERPSSWLAAAAQTTPLAQFVRHYLCKPYAHPNPL